MTHRKIALITSHYLQRPTEDALARLSLECETLVRAYDDFEHIAKLYDSLADEVDGFLVSGLSAMTAIREQAKKTMKPMVTFQADTVALYKQLVMVFLENREQDSRRVVLDFLLPIEGGYTVQDFVACTDVDFINNAIRCWVQQVGAANVEQLILQRILELWDAGEIDLVICQYSSIVPELEARGIPYRYPFFSSSQLGQLIAELEANIELENLRTNLPAVIKVAPRRSGAATDEQMRDLEKVLKQFFDEHLVEGELEHSQDAFTLQTTLQAVRYLTNGGTACLLNAHLGDKRDFEISVGYGVGTTQRQAQRNAQAALRESVFIGGSFFRDEKDNLVGPLTSGTPMVIESRGLEGAGQIASASNLSSLTIQKLMTTIRMSGSNRTTTQELAGSFGVTVRNANRILSNLEKSGYARIVYAQNTNSKGRPVKVYELLLGDKVEN